jgi:hypothetical protein
VTLIEQVLAHSSKFIIGDEALRRVNEPDLVQVSTERHPPMHRRPRLIRLVALAVAAILPVFGLSAMASAAKAKAGPSCAKHPHRAKCATGGGGGTGGTGGTPPNIIVSVSPDPVQESGTSEVSAMVQVEALPIFAGQTINVSSQQLAGDCSSLVWSHIGLVQSTGAGISGVVLDNDGNATVWVLGENCAPGPNLIEADLNGAPYTTATATLTALPPAPTPEPTITGAPNPEVETGDGGPADEESQVYATFLIEENPVYAEQTVEVESSQLFNRCGVDRFWSVGNTATFAPTATVVLDNDGNAVVNFFGISCAAGESTVTADLTVGTHDTFSTTYTIKPPAVTDI